MAASRPGVSAAGGAVVVLLVALALVSVVYISSTQGNGDQIATLQSQVQSLLSKSGGNLPVMNQPPTIRTVRETWYLSPSAHQDRFDPAFIVVNQGDTIRMTFIDNDSVAHDFVIGPPYNIIVNATVPGLVNDLTGENFTTPSRNNQAGCCGLAPPTISGQKYSVSASFSFVAKYSGVYEFVCTYHAEVGMIGYLVVLPNEGYSSQPTTTQTTSSASTRTSSVSIVPGAGSPGSSKWFSPSPITVIIGVNNTVTWTNNDGVPHTVTENNGLFDSGYLAAQASFTYTFTSPGTFAYHCQYHPYMVGTVIVKSPG